MTSPRLAPLTQRSRTGQIDARNQQRALDNATHLRLMRAARDVTIQWRRQSDGSYRIPAGAVLALLEAVDESWDIVKGVDA